MWRKAIAGHVLRHSEFTDGVYTLNPKVTLLIVRVTPADRPVVAGLLFAW